MMNFKPNQILPSRDLIAKNYGADHANKIHSDEGAVKYGYAGALVPGVGVLAYLTRSVADTLGWDWLERGTMRTRFVHPVYHGEEAQVRSRVVGVDPIELELELYNSSNRLCAAGVAGLPPPAPDLNLSDYPLSPAPDRLRPATMAGFSAGEVLGSWEFTPDLAGELTRFLDNIDEPSPIYRGADAVCHPAYFIAQANEILMRNVALGPWIHTASEARHFSIARPGEKMSIRGRVSETYEKRGHEYVALDLGVFSEEERAVARIIHTAIIRLRAA
jgi:acyl dehydratase